MGEGDTTANVSTKDRTEVVKNCIDIVKTVLLALIIALFLFSKGFSEFLLSRFEITEFSIGGAKVEFGNARKALAAANDALAKNHAALRTAQRELNDLRRTYEGTLTALRGSEAALQQLSAQSGATSPGVIQASAVANRTLAQGPAALSSLRSATSAVAGAAQSNEAALALLPRSAQNTGFGIVFGGDSSDSAARDEIKVAAASLSPGDRLRIFKRQNSFRSVALFPTRQAALGWLPRFRSHPRFNDAYLVNMASWCPGVEAIDEVSDCGF